jgi:hypothetical protein
VPPISCRTRDHVASGEATGHPFHPAATAARIRSRASPPVGRAPPVRLGHANCCRSSNARRQGAQRARARCDGAGARNAPGGGSANSSTPAAQQRERHRREARRPADVCSSR